MVLLRFRSLIQLRFRVIRQALTRNGILAYAQDSITSNDISTNLKYVDIASANGPVELTTQGVFVIVTLFSNNGADLIRIINDKTLKQFGAGKNDVQNRCS